MEGLVNNAENEISTNASASDVVVEVDEDSPTQSEHGNEEIHALQVDLVSCSIVKNLSFPDLKAARLTCKVWKQEVDVFLPKQTVTVFTTTSEDSEQDFQRLLDSNCINVRIPHFDIGRNWISFEKFGRLNELSIGRLAYNDIATVLRSCFHFMPNLIKLELFCNAGLPFTFSSTSKVPKVPKLEAGSNSANQTLKLKHFSVQDYSETVEVGYDSFDGPAMDASQEFVQYLKMCSDLIELQVELHRALTFIYFFGYLTDLTDELGPLFRNLTSLSVTTPSKQKLKEFPPLQSIFEASPLQKLQLGVHVNIDFWPRLFRHLPILPTIEELTIWFPDRTLAITENNHVVPVIIECFPRIIGPAWQNLAKLKSLNLQIPFCETFQTRLFIHPGNKQLTHLTHLNFSSGLNTFGDLVNLIKMCPNLSSLAIKAGFSVFEGNVLRLRPLIAVIASLAKLEDLKLDCLSYVNQEGVDNDFIGDEGRSGYHGLQALPGLRRLHLTSSFNLVNVTDASIHRGFLRMPKLQILEIPFQPATFSEAAKKLLEEKGVELINTRLID